MQPTTPWYMSKTLWTNLIAGAGTFLAPKLGLQLDAQTQVSILVVINLVLRAITKQPLSWT